MNDHCCKTHESVKKILNDEVAVEHLSDLFKLMGEPIRTKILLAMLHSEICVKDLALLLNIAQPRISNQLKILKLSKIVKVRKEKNNVFYNLADVRIKEIISIGLKQVDHQG